MKYSYYPGCTLHSTGIEYGASARAMFGFMGVDLVEVPDWNCCGATSAHSLDHDLAALLAGRNLVMAQQAGMDLLVPCAACYSRLRHAGQALAESPELQQRLATAVGIPWQGGVAVESALSVVAERMESAEIAGCVKVELSGLKVVPYYGCLLTRPRVVTGAANPDYPATLDGLLSLLGARVMEWSHKTDCCGGSLTLSRSRSVERLVGRLVDRAVEAGADCIATACPMCQANLEVRQPRGRGIPVFYFTELMGLAFALPEATRWWGKHLVDPRPLLRTAGLPG